MVRRSLRPIRVLVLAALVPLGAAPALANGVESFPFDRDRPAAGRFLGEVAWPGEGPGPVELRLVPPAGEGGAWSGEITRVAAALLHQPLERVSVEGRKVELAVPAPGGPPAVVFSGEVSEDGQTLAGALTPALNGKPSPAFLRRLPLAQDHPGVEHYRGSVDLPGMAVDLALSIGRTPGGRLVGVLDIPIQGALEVTLTEIEVDGRKVSIVLPGPKTPAGPAMLRGERSDDGARMEGQVEQAGAAFPFALARVERRAFARPQTPRPPFPYVTFEVACENEAAAGVKLAGTLTVPGGTGPFPAALLITGSGLQDRDETILGHRPFAVLADHLTRAGIAVLRIDDRGIGRSTGSVAGATTEDFAGDALAGVRFLKSRAEVDPRRIGLVGHSEGGVIAPMVAAKAPDDVAFVVLLAGTAVPGGEILLGQAARAYRTAGLDETGAAACIERRRRLFELMGSDAPAETLTKEVEALVAAELAATPAEKRPKAGVAVLATQAVAQFLDPWTRFFVTYDPRPALAGLRCPVLAINGTLDTQVLWEQNLPEVLRALARGKNRDVTVRALDGLNHLFQTARTGDLAEYVDIEETLSSAALRAVSDWIVERFGGGAPR